jgi:hypothetical protein
MYFIYTGYCVKTSNKKKLAPPPQKIFLCGRNSKDRRSLQKYTIGLEILK